MTRFRARLIRILDHHVDPTTSLATAIFRSSGPRLAPTVDLVGSSPASRQLGCETPHRACPFGQPFGAVAAVKNADLLWVPLHLFGIADRNRPRTTASEDAVNHSQPCAAADTLARCSRRHEPSQRAPPAIRCRSTGRRGRRSPRRHAARRHGALAGPEHKHRGTHLQGVAPCRAWHMQGVAGRGTV